MLKIAVALIILAAAGIALWPMAVKAGQYMKKKYSGMLE